MKRMWMVGLTGVLAMAMPTIAGADNIQMITLNPNTAHELMPLVNRLVLGVIISAMIIGGAILKKRS